MVCRHLPLAANVNFFADNSETYTPAVPQQGNIIGLYVVLPIFFICCCGSSIVYACSRTCRMLRTRPRSEKPPSLLTEQLASPAVPQQLAKPQSPAASSQTNGGKMMTPPPLPPSQQQQQHGPGGSLIAAPVPGVEPAQTSEKTHFVLSPNVLACEVSLKPVSTEGVELKPAN
jgi:hypothetical protein